jgi:Tol biopolymer transport system component
LVNAKAFTDEGDLAFVSRHALWVLDGSNGSLREVAATGAIDPVFSSDGRWLAYVTTGPPPRDGNVVTPPPSQLFIARSDGTAAHAVRGLAKASALAWSPTGDLLAVLNSGNDPGVTIVTPQGSARTIAGTAHASAFVWSPDGRQIAFAGWYQYGALMSVSVNGGSPVLWQAEHDNPAYPKSYDPAIPAKWLPDDEGILFWIDEDDSASIAADGLPLYLVRHAGGNARSLATTLVDPSVITASSNGAFAIDAGANRYLTMTKTVERCTAVTATCTKVSVPSGQVSIDPNLSASGKELVYAEGPSADINFSQANVVKWYSKLSLWTIGSVSKVPVELSGSDGGSVSSWSADGKRLLYQADDALWLLRTASTRPVKIASPLFPTDDWPNYYVQINWSDQFAWAAH